MVKLIDMNKEYHGAGVYVFRARRPGLIGHLPPWFGLVVVVGSAVALAIDGSPLWWALLGLLFNSRHFAYVGQSSAVQLRRSAHVDGGGKFAATAKPWADLVTSWHCLPLPHSTQRMRERVETLAIWLLWPVYNKQDNLWNPRRIPLEAARGQRVMRDHLGWAVNVRTAHLLLLAAIIVGVFW
jgi:hypothetical protein